MAVYICIGFTVLLVGLCVYVAIGSMKTHSGGEKLGEVAEEFIEDGKHYQPGFSLPNTEKRLKKRIAAINLANEIKRRTNEKQSSLKSSNEGKKDY